MKRVAATLTLATALVLAAALEPPPVARACTVTPGADPLDGTDTIFEGRVLAWDGRVLQVLVRRVYLGHGSLFTNVHSVASSCSLQGFVEAGDYVVIGLNASNGVLWGDWPGLAFAAPAPDGPRWDAVQEGLRRRFGRWTPPALPPEWRRWVSAW